MNTKKQKEQEDKLKELAKKPVSEAVKQSIKEKQSQIGKEVCK